MKPNKFREMDRRSCRTRLHETQEQLFRLRFQIGMGQTDGVKKYRELSKDRARMLGVSARAGTRSGEGAGSRTGCQAAKKSSGKKKGSKRWQNSKS